MRQSSSRLLISRAARRDQYAVGQKWNWREMLTSHSRPAYGRQCQLRPNHHKRDRERANKLVEFSCSSSFALSVDLHLHLLGPLSQCLLLFPRGLLFSFRLFFQHAVLIFVFDGSLQHQTISQKSYNRRVNIRTCRFACNCSFWRRMAASLADISSSVKRSCCNIHKTQGLTRWLWEETHSGLRRVRDIRFALLTA